MRFIRQHRSKLTRGLTLAGMASVLLALCLSLDSSVGSASARTAEDARTTGVIVTSDVYLSAENFDAAREPRPIDSCCDGAWRVHFAALLERPSDQAILNLEFYDLSNVDRRTPPNRVLSSAVPVRPGEVMVFVNDFVISKDLGFAAGHQYEVALWSAAETGRTSLAKGGFMLK